MATILLEIARDYPVWCVGSACMCSCVHICVWCPKVCIGVFLYHSFLRQSLTEPGAHGLGSLVANTLQGSSHLQFPSARHTGAHPAFSVAADVQTQVLMFAQQTLTHWATHPNPWLPYLTSQHSRVYLRVNYKVSPRRNTGLGDLFTQWHCLTWGCWTDAGMQLYYLQRTSGCVLADLKPPKLFMAIWQVSSQHFISVRKNSQHPEQATKKRRWQMWTSPLCNLEEDGWRCYLDFREALVRPQLFLPRTTPQ